VTPDSVHIRVRPTGKLLRRGAERFWIKGVTYGTFAPDERGCHFPPPSRVASDFALMRRAGINTVRTYTMPDKYVLDLALEHDLVVMAGIAWAQHVAFLDDRQVAANIRRGVRTQVEAMAGHPAVAMIALGNEIPASVVRWLGPRRVEHFLWTLYDDAKATAPDALLTYVNYPPTEYLNLPFVDVVAFTCSIWPRSRPVGPSRPNGPWHRPIGTHLEKTPAATAHSRRCWKGWRAVSCSAPFSGSAGLVTTRRRPNMRTTGSARP